MKEQCFNDSHLKGMSCKKVTIVQRIKMYLKSELRSIAKKKVLVVGKVFQKMN